MTKPKFLIVSEQKSVFRLYELLLNKYFSSVKNLFIEGYDFIEAIDFNQFNIVLIDLNGKKYSKLYFGFDEEYKKIVITDKNGNIKNVLNFRAMN